ncbi:MAG: hypothetical protein AAGA81_10150 [Acidobacteriota bacterium]
MTQNKDFKRLVRQRMEKTGESYTTARAQLLLQSRAQSDADYAERSGMSLSSVQKATERSWTDWVELLDAAGAETLPHRDIAKIAGAQDGVSPWWSQQVTVGYERIKGLRDVGQRRGGGYDANKSKTLPVTLTRLYRAFAHKTQRERWLDFEWQLRSSKKDRSLRLDAENGQRVQLYFLEKPEGRDGRPRATVQIQHSGLPSRAAVESTKLEWASRLDALDAFLTD